MAPNQRQNRSAQKVDIIPTLGKNFISGGNFNIPIEIRVIKNGRSFATSIDFKQDTNLISRSNTDMNGVANFMFVAPTADAGKNIQLRFHLTHSVEEISFSLTIPQVPSIAGTDPVQLLCAAYVDQCSGAAYVNVRVTDHKGNGLTKKVNFFVQDPLYASRLRSVTTSNQGVAIFSYPRLLNYDEEIEIIGQISGIEQIRKVCLERYPEPVDPEIAHRNNIRFRWFMCAAVISWIICWIVGWGDPILVKPKHSTGDWQKYFWLISFLWTIFSIFYGIFSIREEALQIWLDFKRRYLSHNITKARDSKLERAIEIAENLGIKDHNLSSPDPRAPVIGNVEKRQKGPSFFKLLSSDFIAELVSDFIPKIFIRLFRGR